MLRLAGILLLCNLSLAACNSRSEPTDEAVDQAYENADDQLSGANFEDVADTTQCTSDCSGHDAGFDWARNEGIADASDCSGDSQSFREGCEAFANAREQAADDELQSDEQSEDQ
jgi:hypothetical protein